MSKKTVFRYAVYLLLSVGSSLTAAESLILETNKLSDISQYLEEDTLVILDIDNVLIEPVQMLGSDQWAWSRVKELKGKGVSEKEAFAETMKEWRKAHSLTKVQTPESGASETVSQLQQEGYSIMGLTTRSPEDASLTARELAQVGIDLQLSSIIDYTLELPLKNKAEFTGGILFVSLDNKKGIALKEFLNRIGCHPKKVIFVDDKLSHVKDVEEASLSQEIDYVGIRYSAADSHVAAFDPGIAERQLYFLDHILSDQEAATIKKEL